MLLSSVCTNDIILIINNCFPQLGVLGGWIEQPCLEGSIQKTKPEDSCLLESVAFLLYLDIWETSNLWQLLKF